MSQTPVLFQDLVRVAVVDDHDAIRFGFEASCSKYNFDLVASAASVGECIELFGDNQPQVVVLDLSLADGSNVSQNVSAFVSKGIQVLIYSNGDKVPLIRAAMKAGAALLVTKSETMDELAKAIYLIAHGVYINNTQTAAAIDNDIEFKDAKLSDRERSVLSLYASGLTQKQVGFELNIAQSTVKEHIDRVRSKYADVGRPVTDKTDFLKRAIEDGLIDDII
ncbi:MAG: response regulator transcription factor [Micrococcales bacterium]